MSNNLVEHKALWQQMAEKTISIAQAHGGFVLQKKTQAGEMLVFMDIDDLCAYLKDKHFVKVNQPKKS